MRFSDTFGIRVTGADDWFDPVLSIDTRLFIDPFLLYSFEFGPFQGSHAEIIGFFNNVFQLVARSGGDPTSLMWRRAKGILVFPEAEELCLGYATSSTKGAGSGRGFAKIITEALWEAVEVGVEAFDHFEEIGILREGIGADRISDITANLLRHRLASYTTAICARHEIPVRAFNYAHGIYSPEFNRWMPLTINVPENPYNRLPVLLAPRRYLKDLPTISAQAFWDFCYTNENEILRNDFGADITRNVDKKTIIDFARNHPELRAEFVEATEEAGGEPYDYAADRKGYVKWYEAAAGYVNAHPLALAFLTVDQFRDFNLALLREFRNYVENNEGWRLLWNDDDSPRSEEAAQLLFIGVAKHYCKANNIDISREANIGRGPVDFKVAQGYQCRSLLELKLAKNSKFWNGLAKQLPTYQAAEDISIGYFVVILQTNKDEERIRDIEARVAEVNAATGYEITAFVVDARRDPPSASRL